MVDFRVPCPRLDQCVVVWPHILLDLRHAWLQFQGNVLSWCFGTSFRQILQCNVVAPVVSIQWRIVPPTTGLGKSRPFEASGPLTDIPTPSMLRCRTPAAPPPACQPPLVRPPARRLRPEAGLAMVLAGFIGPICSTVFIFLKANNGFRMSLVLSFSRYEIVCDCGTPGRHPHASSVSAWLSQNAATVPRLLEVAGVPALVLGAPLAHTQMRAWEATA